MDGINYMDIGEFREFGYLQEVNRMFFHPLGLALEVSIDEETGVESISGVWDYRADPEGMSYGPDMLSVEKHERVMGEIKGRHHVRVTRLGYWMQRVE